MSNYLKPQSPLYHKAEDTYFYPLTTSDQIIVNENRLSDYSIILDNNLNIILSASKWTEANGQYEQSITIDNLDENYNVDAKIAYTGNYNTDLLIINNAAYIKYAKQNNNIITFYCLGGNPKIDIPVELEVYI